jgi:hypothetical protein
LTESNAVDTLQKQFAGYGSTSQTVARCLDRTGIKEPLEEWSDETVEVVVNAFIDEKFPTVFALNKIDHPDADKVRGPGGLSFTMLIWKYRTSAKLPRCKIPKALFFAPLSQKSSSAD